MDDTLRTARFLSVPIDPEGGLVRRLEKETLR